MDDDKTRRHTIIAIMSFCVVIIIYMLAAMLLRAGHLAHFWDFVVAIVLGTLAAGAGFAVANILDI
jgi:hypothetical protein